MPMLGCSRNVVCLFILSSLHHLKRYIHSSGTLKNLPRYLSCIPHQCCLELRLELGDDIFFFYNNSVIIDKDTCT